MPNFAQQATDTTKPPQQTNLPAELKPAPVPDIPELAMTQADTVSRGETAFFTPTQLATLRRLCLPDCSRGGGQARSAWRRVYRTFWISSSANHPRAPEPVPQRSGPMDKRGAEAIGQGICGQSFAEIGNTQRQPLLQPSGRARRQAAYCPGGKGRYPACDIQFAGMGRGLHPAPWLRPVGTYWSPWNEPE